MGDLRASVNKYLEKKSLFSASQAYYLKQAMKKKAEWIYMYFMFWRLLLELQDLEYA